VTPGSSFRRHHLALVLFVFEILDSSVTCADKVAATGSYLAHPPVCTRYAYFSHRTARQARSSSLLHRISPPQPLTAVAVFLLFARAVLVARSDLGSRRLAVHFHGIARRLPAVAGVLLPSRPVLAESEPVRVADASPMMPSPLVCFRRAGRRRRVLVTVDCRCAVSLSRRLAYDAVAASMLPPRRPSPSPSTLALIIVDRG
jgi:hypothetical protein